MGKIFLQLRTHLLLNLSICQAKLCDYKAAISSASAVLEKDPSCCQAYCARARAHQEAGDLNKASQDLTKAVRLAPSDRELCTALIKLKEELRTRGSSQSEQQEGDETTGIQFSQILDRGFGEG